MCLCMYMATIRHLKKNNHFGQNFDLRIVALGNYQLRYNPRWLFICSSSPSWLILSFLTIYKSGSPSSNFPLPSISIDLLLHVIGQKHQTALHFVCFLLNRVQPSWSGPRLHFLPHLPLFPESFSY